MKWILVLVCLCVVIRCENILDAMSRNPDLSKFLELVKEDDILVQMITSRSLTVFAPNNEAMERGQQWLNKVKTKVASYHILNSLVPQSEFGKVQQSPNIAGSPPLYLLAKKTEDGDIEDYFVNNAKIIETSEFTISEYVHQILYIIDEMLEPYVTNAASPAPNAFKFMEQPGTYDVMDSLRVFVSRVKSESQQELFSNEGTHTYFLPANLNKTMDMDKYKKLTSAVIRSHIIKDKVLFTRIAGNLPYKSATYNEQLQVNLSIVNQSSFSDYDNILYAESNILRNLVSHRKGIVLSKITRPNIPVANGVVHLIESPLMIIDKTIWDFIVKERHGRLTEFYKLVENAPEFKSLIENSQEKTLFAPSNKALRQFPSEKLQRIRSNNTELNNLLKLHLVMKSIYSEDIKSDKIGLQRELTADNHRYLYFGLMNKEDKQILTVEGGGVNANTVLANIGATDGLIHIIDRILGMPYQSVYEKLKNDPSLKTTYELSKQNSWNSQLRDNNLRFTFFAPSEKAWDDLKNQMPSDFKKMSMGLFPTHVYKILDRHLIIDEELSTQDLEKREEIHMKEGIFKISTGHGKITVKWEHEQASIVRPGVQATNGVIHVIDKVMMKPRDLSSKASQLQFTLVYMLGAYLLLLMIF